MVSSDSISSAARFAETERVMGRRGGLMTSMDISSSLEQPGSSSMGGPLVIGYTWSRNLTYRDLVGLPTLTSLSR